MCIFILLLLIPPCQHLCACQKFFYLVNNYIFAISRHYDMILDYHKLMMEYLFFPFKWVRGKDLKTGYN